MAPEAGPTLRIHGSINLTGWVIFKTERGHEILGRREVGVYLGAGEVVG